MKQIKLCDLHDSINALGGYASNEEEQGYVNAITDVLSLVERLEPQPFDILQHLQDGGKVTEDFDSRVYWLKGPYLWSIRDGETEQECTMILRNDFLRHFMHGHLKPYQEPPAEFSVEWAVDQMETHGQRVTVEGVVGVLFWWFADGKFIQTDDLMQCSGIKEFNKETFLSMGCKSTWKIFVSPPVEGSREWARQQDFRVCHERMDNPGAWVDFSKGTNTMLLDNDTAWESSMYDNGWSEWEETREYGFYWAIHCAKNAPVAPWKFTEHGWWNDAEDTFLEDRNFFWIDEPSNRLQEPERES